MSSLRPFVIAVLAILLGAHSALAERTVLARVEGGALTEAGEDVVLRLALSDRPLWRVYVLDAPRRLVVDLMNAEWPEALSLASDRAGPAEIERFDADWSRLTLPLSEPLAIAATSMDLDAGEASLSVRLEPVSPETFEARAGAPEYLVRPEPITVPPRTRGSDGAVRVMLDPGHGGFDPGAEAGGLVEADLMLSFAKELRSVLTEAGMEVALTREADDFVSLEARMSAARAFDADLLLSLHADALPEDAGRASGATVYTLSEEASAVASQRLVERHGKDDLIAGLTLEGHGEDVSLVLMDLVRRDTAPRSVVLAETLLAHIRAGTGHVSGRPQRVADFSVLRAPDFPSVLLELGFLSSKTDRARLVEADWRQRTAEAIRDGLSAWAETDRAGASK